MEDFGQLIAIIVGVILLAINALGKKKKPVPPSQNQRTSTPSIPRTRTGIPELDMFLEEISGHDEEQKVDEPVSSPAYESLETIEHDSPYAEYNSINYFDEVQHNTNHVKLGDEIKQTVKENLEDSEDLKHQNLNTNFEFNLRDAIIFSEILKRPSY